MKNVLAVCAYGRNRSKYLAKYLKGKGYRTRFAGMEIDEKNPINQKIITNEDVDWADIIIFVKPKLERLFKEKYKFNKKVIVIKVTDVKELIPEKFAHLRKLPEKEFQKKWTYHQLRKSIKPYLPL